MEKKSHQHIKNKDQPEASTIANHVAIMSNMKYSMWGLEVFKLQCGQACQNIDKC